MSACVDHPFSVSCCCSIFFSLSCFVFSFFSFVFVRVGFLDYARLCEKNRKSWPALQHRFIFLLVAVFSRSSGLRSFLLRLSSPSTSSWSNCLPAANETTKSPFLKCLSANQSRNGILTERSNEISSMVVHVVGLLLRKSIDLSRSRVLGEYKDVSCGKKRRAN